MSAYDHTILDPADLLKHESWLRPLIRGLVVEHDVDDVLQEIWLSALHVRGPVRASAALLKTIARNFTVSMHRKKAVRTVVNRGVRAAKVVLDAQSHAPSTAEVVERLASQRLVTEAVTDLTEPYRSVVLMRFYQEMTPAEIALQHGVTASAVRQQLSRGMAMLRAKMEMRFGGDWRCSPALLDLTLGANTAATSAGASVLIMTNSRLLAAAALVLFTLGLGIWLANPFGDGSTADASVGKVAQDATRGGAQEATETGAKLTRTVLASNAEEAVTRMSPMPVPFEVFGRVVDVRGMPIEGVGIALHYRSESAKNAQRNWWDMPKMRHESLTHSDRLGTFRIVADKPGGTLYPTGPYVALRETRVARSEVQRVGGKARRIEHTLLVSGTVALKGRVRAPDGGWAGLVHIGALPSEMTEFPGDLDHTLRIDGWTARSDHEGRFSLSMVPVEVRSVRFFATGKGSRGGNGEIELPVPKHDAPDMVVVMSAMDAAPWKFCGTVRDHLGRPIEGVRVGEHGSDCFADEHGRYEFEFLITGTENVSDRLAVRKQDFQGSVFVGMHQRMRDSKNRTTEVDLQLGAPSLSISGRVVWPDGSPATGVYVYPYDADAVSPPARTAERSCAKEDLAVDRDGPKMDWGGFAWTRAFTRTDENGRFVLEGLFDKAYRLRLFARDRHLAVVTEESVSAGSEHQRFTLRASQDSLQGRLVDDRGMPIAGAELVAEIPVHAVSGVVSHFAVGKALSDENGRFVIPQVQVGQVRVRLRHDRMLPLAIDLDTNGKAKTVAQLSTTMQRRCRFRVVIRNPNIEGCRLVDAKGKTLVLYTFEGDSHRTRELVGFINGRTPTRTTTLAATHLVLLDSNRKEIAKHAIRLVANKLTTLVY